MENTFDIALTVLAENGWQQGDFGDKESGVCLLGALAVAIDGFETPTDDDTPWPVTPNLYHVTACYEWRDRYEPGDKWFNPEGDDLYPEQRVLAEVIQERYPEYDRDAFRTNSSVVTEFNDAEGRTLQEVIDVLEAAAARWEEHANATQLDN